MTGYHKKSKFPSVTKVLSVYSGYDTIHPGRLQEAAKRGTIVHEYCAAMATGKWMPKPAAELSGYVQSARMWLDSYMDEALLVEAELEDAELGYCGHPDMMIRSKKLGGIVLVDFKTPASVHRKIWGAQLAAYERLVQAARYPKPDRIGSLRIRKDGRAARFDEFTDNRLAFWAAFYAALAAYRFFCE